MKRTIQASPILPVFFLLAAIGCNNSRYGVNHDERLPSIQRVGIIAPSVKVFSLHTGGVQEERPDMEPQVRQQALAWVQDEVRRCKRDPVLLEPATATTQPAETAKTHRLALLAAISEAIVTHHYLCGKERMIDYSAGDVPKVLGRDDLDALLCIDIQGIIPTAGRKFLHGTAIAMGVLTGVHIHVQTKQATVALMLVERKHGEILWFNAAIKEIKVSDEHDFRDLCKDACKYLLKPSK